MARAALFKDGVLIGEVADFVGEFTVPADAAGIASKSRHNG
jgi:hypothetical protein